MIRTRRPARGFTAVELIVVVLLCLIAVAFLVPSRQRHKVHSNTASCASHLKQIGQGMLLYANENRGAYPRTRATPGAAVTAWTGTNDSNPFDGVNDPLDNDVTAAVFLLVRTQEMGTEVFTCPSANEVKFDPPQPIAQYANFPARNHLSYSMAVMYPTPVVARLGYKWNNTLDADFAVAADWNPGADASPFTHNSSAAVQKKLNSRNHGNDGQNVLFGDGHVEFTDTAFCGSEKDYIYAPAVTGDGLKPPYKPAAPSTQPTFANDSVLLPAER
jgi:prepilin-type processing-associated H-X9-DG protein